MNKLVIAPIMSLMVILVASLVLTTQDSYAQGPAYKIKVTFDSITIHDNQEGALSGDGEWDLSSYVQGKRVDLTGGTSNKLWDAEERTYHFNPGTEVTVEVPEGGTFLIATSGWEIDNERGTWRADDDPFVLENLAALNDPKVVDKGQAIANFAGSMYIDADPGLINTNRNDGLGELVRPYDLTTEFGKGSHEENSYRFVYGEGEQPPDYTLRYTIIVTPPRQIGVISPGVPVLEVVCMGNNLPVSSATSSGDLPTFPPANAIDNNPNTKWWSTIIIDPFITLDLGASKSVCGVDIAWADGNLHPYRFDVSVSPDGSSFTNVLSATSNGTSSSPEKYNFSQTQARYVKITITESIVGSQRSIAQISEIDVFG